MIELYIENQPVDINETFSTLITFSVDDVRDFGAKNTAFSKTIILPGTKNNNILFGNIFSVNRLTQYSSSLPNFGLNFNAGVSARAIIFADNIQVFKGVLRLMEIVIDGGHIEYEVVVFGELGGLVAKMGTAKLQDLDFSAYNHIYSEANISGSWANENGGSGYYYPLIDYGTYSSGKHDWQYKTMRPAFFTKEYIEKIFAASGYTFDCTLFTTDRFKRLIHPNDKKELTRVTDQVLEYSIDTQTFSKAHQTSVPALDFLPLNMTSVTAGAFTYSQVGNNTRFTSTGSGSLTLTTKIKITGTLNSGAVNSITFFLDIINGGALAYTTMVAVLPTTTVGGGNFTAMLELDNKNVDPAGYIQLRAQVFRQVSGINAAAYNITFTGVNITAKTSAPISVPVSIGENIVANDILPQNYLQKDYLSSILKLFNLYLTEDKFKANHLVITPYVDFYDLSTSIDWSDKIDRSKPMSIKPMSELNSRYYEFKYKEDSDYWNDLYKKRYNQSYGDYIFDSQFEFANDKETVDIIFSGTPLVGYAGEDKVYPTIFKKSGTTEDTTDSNLRILIAKKVTGVASWKLLNGGSTLGTYTDYPYAGHFDDPDVPANDLNFGVPNELFFSLASGSININQFNVYWSPLMAEITDVDSKLLTVTVRLTRKDINNLDFSKFIWIDGSKFRLNKINDYNATNEDTCTCELLKVINTQY